MIIKFKELELENFKSHQQLKVNFGEITKITGDNAVGKSSIGEAISFLLYGTDTLGSKLDPTPTTYEADKTAVSLLLEIDGTALKLGRNIEGGRNKYIINDVPSKATEFNETIEHLFDKDLFLSLFNPSYYFTLHWTKQREMLLEYVTPPANSEVFKQLPEVQSKKLGELVKKHSLEDLDKIHRDNKRKLDKEIIAAQSRTKTLQEQLDQIDYVPPKSSLRTVISQTKSKLAEKKEVIDNANENNVEISRLQNEIDFMTQTIDNGRKTHSELKSKEIDSKCYACGTELQPDAIKKVESEREKELQKIADKVNPLIKKRRESREKLSKLEAVKVDEDLLKEVEEMENTILENERQLHEHDRIDKLDQEVKQAKEDEKKVRESLNESTFIIDAIKDFDAKEAELQAEKVQGLFETLSIKLSELVKTTGEMKQTFEIKMDDKEYVKLSTAEKILAGLELRNVLSQESGLIAPCFVDNAESITKFKQPIGQLITATVVGGEKLEVVNE